MSTDPNAQPAANPTALFNITGSPALDSLIRKGIVAAATAGATYFATKLGNTKAPAVAPVVTAAFAAARASNAS